MPEHKASLGMQRLAAAVACLILLAAGAAFLSTRTQGTGRSRRQVLVKNRTSSLQVVSSEVVSDSSSELAGGRVLLRLKNASRKWIDGYTMYYGDGTLVTTDYTIGEALIAADQVEEVWTTTNMLAAPGSADASLEVEVLAVTFTDRSSEGDAKSAAAIFNKRRGVEMQLRRLAPLLEDALQATDDGLPAALATLKSRLASLPDPPERDLPRAVRHGLRDAKRDVIFRIQELEREGEGIRPKLVELKTQVEKRAARLRASGDQ